MSDYEAWNTALSEQYFTPALAGRPVYLDADDDTLDVVAARLGVAAGWVGLSTVVVSTLNWSSPTKVLQAHAQSVDAWRRGNRGSLTDRKRRVAPPPDVALLTFFSRIAATMGEERELSANAYYPLAARLLGWDDGRRQMFQQSYMRHSENLWQALNDYLLWNDGLYGTPTAYSLGARFVGLAQSQAIVRQVDRAKLPRLFRRFGLAPRTDMLPQEVARLFDIWVSQKPCPVSQPLLRLWQSSETAKQRISTVVATELASWDGSVARSASEGGFGSTGGLWLTADLVRRLGTRLDLSFLAATGRDDVDQLEVTSAKGAPSIDVMPVDSVRCAPATSLSLDAGSLLEGKLELKDPVTDVSLVHHARNIVPFVKDTHLNIWTEVSAVQLCDTHLVLVRDTKTVLSAVSKVLDGGVGRHGKVFTHDGRDGTESLRGVPAGWRVFEDVQVFGAPTAVPQVLDIDSLIPMVSSTLRLNGGLRLPGRVRKWSSAAPPDLVAVSAGAERVALTLTDPFGGVVAEWSEDGEIIEVSLAGLDLTDGDYRVSLTAGRKEIAQRDLILRSGDTPDQFTWEMAHRLVHDMDDPLSSLTAQPVVGGEFGDRVVDGPWASIVDGAEQATALPPSQPWWSADPSAAPEPEKGLVLTSRSKLRGDLLAFSIEPGEFVVHDKEGVAVFAGMLTRSVKGADKEYLELSYAGSDKVLVPAERASHVRRYRGSTAPRVKRLGRHMANASVARAVPVVTRALSTVVGAAKAESTELGLDVAVDALVHVGGGPISALERIASQLDPSALFADRLVRDLEALAMIDVRRDESLRPTEWEMPPAYLAELPDGRWAFAGVWTAASRAALEVAVSAAGGSLDAFVVPDQPTQWTVSGLDGAELDEVLTSTGIGTLAPDAPRRIADLLPILSEVQERLPLIDLPQYRSVEWFDLEGARWLQRDGVTRPGAYRLAQAYRKIDVFVPETMLAERKGYRGSVQLIKHLAAMQAARPLLAYDPDARQLSAPSGAELPSLFGRAAVLCSGLLPTPDRQHRRVVYMDVPDDIAAVLFDRLSR